MPNSTLELHKGCCVVTRYSGAKMETIDGKIWPVRVLIVDDCEPWVNFVLKLLNGVPGLRVVGIALDGNDAIIQTQLLRPDLVLMEISLPFRNGIDAARQIIRFVPGSRIIFVSQKYQPPLVQAALAAGGQGYVVKVDVASELLRAMEAVVEGSRYFSRTLLGPDLTATRVM